MPATRDSVLAAVAAAFTQPAAGRVIGALNQYGIAPHERERERVQLAILGLAAGSEAKVIDLVAVAKTDYRDVLAWHDRSPITPEQLQKERAMAAELIERWGKK